VSVKDSDDREKVVQEFGEYDLMAMPVTDGEGRLVGIITSDDILDVVVEEATEDAHRMGAVDPMEENVSRGQFFLRVAKTGLLAGDVVHRRGCSPSTRWPISMMP
jgi:magnesium transporter